METRKSRGLRNGVRVVDRDGDIDGVEVNGIFNG